MNIIEKLDDLIHQATHERSHYYTAGVLKEAKAEITRARAALSLIRAEVGCAYQPTPTELRIDGHAAAALMTKAQLTEFGYGPDNPEHPSPGR